MSPEARTHKSLARHIKDDKETSLRASLRPPREKNTFPGLDVMSPARRRDIFFPGPLRPRRLRQSEEGKGEPRYRPRVDNNLR